MFRSEIEILAEILDEHIVKGLSKDRPKSKIERLEKALSHDPFTPHDMGYDSPYYNPYKMAPEGGFLPYTGDHWADQGKDRQAYLTTDQFYERYGAVEQAVTKFRGFARALERGDLVKAGAVPIGTVHVYADGQRYKKIAEGQWAPVAGLEDKSHAKWLTHKDEKSRTKAHQMIEDHAGQVTKIQSVMKDKQKHAATVDEAKKQAVKETLSHVKNLMGQMFDGPMPEGIGKMFEQAQKKSGIGTKDHLKDVEKEVGGQKTHDVHVRLNHNGQVFEHVFKNVQANSHGEAHEKVTSAIKKKLGAGVGFEKVSIKKPGEKPKPEASV